MNLKTDLHVIFLHACILNKFRKSCEELEFCFHLQLHVQNKCPLIFTFAFTVVTLSLDA